MCIQVTLRQLTREKRHITKYFFLRLGFRESKTFLFATRFAAENCTQRPRVSNAKKSPLRPKPWTPRAEHAPRACVAWHRRVPAGTKTTRCARRRSVHQNGCAHSKTSSRAHSRFRQRNAKLLGSNTPLLTEEQGRYGTSCALILRVVRTPPPGDTRNRPQLRRHRRLPKATGRPWRSKDEPNSRSAALPPAEGGQR